MNFGKDVSTLKYFTICGLQEGYEPFAVNMNRDVTMWLSKRLPQFVPVPNNHQHIEVRGVTCTTHSHSEASSVVFFGSSIETWLRSAPKWNHWRHILSLMSFMFMVSDVSSIFR